MSSTSNETNNVPKQQAGQDYELDLHAIARLTFRTSPWLFFSIIAAFVGGIGFSMHKYYELRGLITETNHQIELLRQEIKHNVELLKAHPVPASTMPNTTPKTN